MATKKKADIITSSGFKCNLDANRLNNMELFDELASFQDGDARALSRVLTMLLGDEKKKLYDHLRTEDGRVPIEDLARELTEIMKGVNEGKNS